MITKKCSKCNKEKPLSDFHKDKKGKFGVRSDCKDCVSKRHNQYSQEKYSNWKKKHQKQGTVIYWNYRARKVNERALNIHNVKTKITGEELFNKFNSNAKICYYCGVDITHDKCHIEHKNSMYNGGENHINNIVFSCGKCNLTKNNKSDVEFFNYIKTLYFNLKDKYE